MELSISEIEDMVCRMGHRLNPDISKTIYRSVRHLPLGQAKDITKTIIDWVDAADMAAYNAGTYEEGQQEATRLIRTLERAAEISIVISKVEAPGTEPQGVATQIMVKWMNGNSHTKIDVFSFFAWEYVTVPMPPYDCTMTFRRDNVDFDMIADNIRYNAGLRQAKDRTDIRRQWSAAAEEAKHLYRWIVEGPGQCLNIERRGETEKQAAKSFIMEMLEVPDDRQERFRELL
ncbi:MAG: hypothetical protein MJZ06_04140 [Bacteroidaceae bacterium]|nr:hypothetical protein [Bacteroidaceae bacterium]